MAAGGAGKEVNDTEPPSKIPPPSLGADNYEIGGAIARGGMGSILAAEDCNLKREVAIKVMSLDADADDSMRRRFLREAEVLAKLSHPNIVPIYDLVWEDDLPLFYSMKLVKGRTLQAILDALRDEDPASLRDFSLDRLLLIFRKICDAIAFAHSKGVLHRDLKPENIMVGEFGEVLVMDWGLAKILGEEDLAPSSSPPQEPELGRTLDGTVMGTPQFMSPEQAMGLVKTLDERSDIYSLGAILYALLTLRPPVEGKTAQEILSKVSSGHVTPPSALHSKSGTKLSPHDQGEVLEAKQIKPLPHTPGGRIPAALSSVVMKALQREKGDRYQDIGALNDDVEAFQGGFATSAEEAGTLTQIRLLLGRHKIISSALAALLIISIGFVLKLVASEQIATAHAKNAETQAQRATASAQESQRSLAKAQISLAEAAFQRSDQAVMIDALEATPLALRDQNWHYFSAKRDSSLGHLKVKEFNSPVDIHAVPNEPGQFAIANLKGEIGFIDVNSETLLRTIATGDSGKMRFCFSGDGRRLLSFADNAPNARLFDTTTGRQIQSISVGHHDDGIPPPRPFTSVALNQNGSLAAIAHSKLTRIQVIETTTGRVLWQHKGVSTRWYVRMEFHPNGRRLLVLNPAHRVFDLLDVTDGRLIVSHYLSPQSMALSPDGEMVALGLNRGELVLLDAMTGEELRRAQLYNNPISAVDWTAGGHLLTLGGDGRRGIQRMTLRLWDPKDFDPRGTFFGANDPDPHLVARLNPVSGHLLTKQAPLQLWQFPDIPLAHIKQTSDKGWSCNFLSNTALLARSTHRLNYYDVSNPQEPVAGANVGRDWRAMATVDQDSGIFAIGMPHLKFPPASPATPSSLKLSQLTVEGVVDHWDRPLQQETIGLDFDAEVKKLLVVTSRGWPPVPFGILVLDVADGRTLMELNHAVDGAVFAGTQGWIAALEPLSKDGQEKGSRLILIDPADGEIRHSITSPSRLNAIAASPDRSLVAVAGDDQMVVILDADTLEERVRFRAHDAAITALKFHPHKPLLATGSMDLSVKLWDYQSAQVQQTILGLEGHPIAMTISPNGDLIAVDGMGKSFRIYRLTATNSSKHR